MGVGCGTTQTRSETMQTTKRDEWRCLHCGHVLEDGEVCPMPDCVEGREAARRRMGVQVVTKLGDDRDRR